MTEALRIRSLLVPLDGSPFAEQALPWAIAIARKFRARLRLAMAHQFPSPPPLDETTARLYTKVELALRKSQGDYLRRTATRIKADEGIQTATAMLEAPAAPALAKYVAEIGADLVVMTTHGRGGLERAWLGSVADRLIRTLEIPILLIRATAGQGAPPSAQRLLVPLDGSRRAEAILPAAMALAAVTDAEITLLQVVPPVPAMGDLPTTYPMGIDEELTQLERNQAQDYMSSLAEQLTAGGFRASGVAVLGASAFGTIQDAARERGTGLIALATHGRGGVRRMILGSNADKLIRAGDLPVLVTHARGR